MTSGDGNASSSLHWKVLAGLALGVLAGAIANHLARSNESARSVAFWLADVVAHPIGQIFLRLLFIVVVPIVFTSLAVGVASLGNLKKLGRLGARTFAFFVAASSVAAILGVAATSFVAPGEGFDADTRASLMEQFGGMAREIQAKAAAERAGSAVEQWNRVLDWFLPRNILAAIVDMQILPIVVFALLFGAALTLLAEHKRTRIRDALEIVAEASVAIVGFAMKLAPFAVFCLLYAVIARFGLDLLQKLAVYMLLVIAGYAVLLFAFYPLLLAVLAKRNPLVFLKQTLPVMVTALSTSSSNATLPSALQIARTELGIRPHVAGFVLPLGATMNQNGTALFEGCVVLFVAQIFGIDLSFAQELVVVFLCVVTSIAAAGIPGGSYPLLMSIMATAGVPPDGIAIILGVDRLLDMGRTVINVMGDLVCAAWIDRLERA